MILHYIITAWRCILKFKTQNLIAVLGLSVALFCFSICLYISRYVYSTDNCFEQRNRIVQFSTQNPETGVSNGLTFCDISDDLKKFSISGIDTYIYTNYVDNRSYNVEVAEGKMLPYTLAVMETDSAYLRVFTPKVLHGSWQQAAHAPNSILLSETMAKRIFGNPTEAVGKQMVLTHKLMTSPDSTPRTGGIAYTIQGVMEDMPLNNSLNFLRNTDAWVLNDSEGILNCGWKHSMASGCTYALLSEDVEQEAFCREFNARKLEGDYFGQRLPIVAFPFNELFWKGDRAYAPYLALTTLIAGVLMLLVGMLNFFHFLTGSFVTRIREYSLRRVSGARGWQLWTMLFVQSLLLLLVSGLFCMMLMELTAPFLSINMFEMSITIERDVMMWQTGGYLLGLLVCCMIAAALVVWKVERINIQRGLFGGGGVYGKHRVRNVLLGVQLFICWIFVTLATMLYLQSQRASNTLFGTLTQSEKENIYSIPMHEYTFLSQEERLNLVAELSKVTGVKEMLPASMEGYTRGVTMSAVFTQPGRNRDHVKSVTVLYVVPDFFKFMNMPLQAGVLPKTENEIVVTEGLEKMMEKEMLGEMLYDYGDKGYTVTAICQPLIQSIQASSGNFNQNVCVFYPLEEYEIYHCHVKCEPGQKKQVGEGLEKVLRKHLPESIDIRLKTLMDDIRMKQSMEFMLRGIVAFFSIVALIIVLLGIYAAITLDTEYRRKEMAIRKVNGAGIKQIAFIFARLYIWLLLITAAVAFPIVWVIHNLIKTSYAIFIDTGILFYGGIFLGMAAIVALTVGFRIYLITKVNPAEIIRKE